MASSSTTLEEWKIERQELLQQIKKLERKVQQPPIKSKLSSNTTTPKVEENLLHEFYTLGLKLFEAEPDEEHHIKSITIEAEPEEHHIPTSTINKNAFLKMPMMNLQNVSSSSDDDRLVEILPKSVPGNRSQAIDYLVKKVFDLYKPPQGDLKYLQGNFGPVRVETPPTQVIITDGTIPGDLNGMMLRNGPDPQFDPEGHYSWLDGESMIHGILFKDGNATYVARYTKTSRYIQQKDFNRSEFLKFGDLYGHYGVFATFVDILRTRVQILDKSFGETTANNNIVYHARRIMALDDFGKPHVIYVTKDGDLNTLGINDYEGKLNHPLSPHPVKDPVTGEMFVLGSMREPPFCIYRKISKRGHMSDRVNITVDEPTFMHSLSITEKYVIFQELPLVYDPEAMQSDDHRWIYSYTDNKWPRYGVLNRDANSEDDKKTGKIKWFEFTNDSFYAFHNANAWEQDKYTIVLYSCVLEAETKKDGSKYIFPAGFQRYENSHPEFKITSPRLYKMTFAMTPSGDPIFAAKKRISDISVGFPKINENYMGRKSKYIYMSEFDGDNKIVSIVKFDLEKENGDLVEYVKYEFELNTFGGEVVFVPRSEEDDDEAKDEDDGYLIVFVHREHIINKKDLGTSYVYVLDAKMMKRVVELQLPNRVPYGFHATYVTEEELLKQKKPRSALRGE